MKKVREVLRLHIIMKFSVRKIQTASGVARSTVQDYVKRLKSSNLTADEIDTLDDDALRFKLFPDCSSITTSFKAMPNMHYLYNELKTRKKSKVTLTLLWEEYKKDNPDGYEFTQFRVYYKRYCQTLFSNYLETL
ncbi:MAG: helix-turn-helix domain-containing protein [Campylobacteraceae bacterium]|nr:helix-turn-helix domain-containing protein [Campylobacteraceae bacterium]